MPMLAKNFRRFILVLLLLLVRQWDPATGKLRLHLPMHNVELQLQCVDNRLPAAKFETGEVLQGKIRPGNVIEIRQRMFEIKAITFKEAR